MSEARALIETVADMLPQVQAETPGDTLSDAQALVETLADFSKLWSTSWLSRKQRWRQ